MIVNLVDVFLHLACQRWSDFAAAGFASQMCRIGLELGLARSCSTGRRAVNFSFGDGLLKFCVAFVHLGVERGGVETFAGHGELVDKRELKTAQAFDPSIASGLMDSRSAATRDGDCGSAEERVSNNEILGRHLDS